MENFYPHLEEIKMHGQKIECKILDFLAEKIAAELGGKANDAAVAKYFKIQAPVISKIRNGKAKVNSDFILSIHEKLGIPVKEIREML